MWNTFILNPMLNSLLWLYGLLGNNYLVAILLLTFLIKMITWPLTWKQLGSTAKMQELQPELKKLQEKYRGEPEKLNREMMELYKQAGVNPLGGCLPTLIQFPILIGLYQAITNSLAASPLQLLSLSQHIYHDLPAFLRWLPNADALIPLESRVLWLDLAKPDPLFILTVLTVLSTMLQQKLMTPPSTDAQQASMTRSMQLVMPLMIGMYSIWFPSGLAIYWVTSNIIGIGQYAAMGKVNWKTIFLDENGKFNLGSFIGLPSEPATPAPRRGSEQKKSSSRSSKKA